MNRPATRLVPLIITLASFAHADEARDATFYNARIQPVLARECYSCHSPDAAKLKGGLRLDSREAMLQGGDAGPAIVAGKPAESLLIQALRHEGDLAMPPKKPKLAAKAS